MNRSGAPFFTRLSRNYAMWALLVFYGSRFRQQPASAIDRLTIGGDQSARKAGKLQAVFYAADRATADDRHGCPRRRNRRARSIRPGIPVLAVAGLDQLRRPGRPDRDHAPGTGREKTLDFGEALPACAEL